MVGELQEKPIVCVIYEKPTQQQVESPGLYYEVKCQNVGCKNFKLRSYVYLGIEKEFDFRTEAQGCFCESCFQEVKNIVNIGFYKCKWSYKGQTDCGKLDIRPPQLSPDYTSIYDLKLKKWKWLKLWATYFSQTEAAELSKGGLELPVKRLHDKETYNPKKKHNSVQVSPSSAEVSVQTEKLEDFQEELQQIKEEIRIKSSLVYYLKKHIKDQQKEIQKWENKLSYKVN